MPSGQAQSYGRIAMGMRLTIARSDVVGPLRSVLAPVPVDTSKYKFVIDDLVPIPPNEAERHARLCGHLGNELGWLLIWHEHGVLPMIAAGRDTKKFKSDAPAQKPVHNIAAVGAGEAMPGP